MNLRLVLTLAPAMLIALTACPEDDTGTDDTDGVVDLPTNFDCDDGLNPGSICTITGDILEDVTLTPEVTWVLSGRVRVGDDGAACPTLTIDAGTTIFGATGQRSFLSIQRCAKIDAQGTADEPIVLTSGATDKNPGDWGGLVINGYGENNLCADPSDCNIEGEGESGQYGGDDNGDDSGTLSYVVVTHAGDNVTDDDQLNGIAFQAVGSGTSVDHIQVHRNKDDGIEFFGGAVDVKYAVVTGAHDDSVDWTNGWTGRMQHVVVQQWDDAGERGIEADNDEDAPDASPRSKPTISHATFIGSKASSNGSHGLVLRRGTGFNGHNLLIANFKDTCIDLDDEATFANTYSAGNPAPNGQMTIDNSIVVDCDGGLFDDDAGDLFAISTWYTDDQPTNTADDSGTTADYIESITPLTDPNWASKGDATSGGASPSDSWFDAGSHIGGVAPGSDWTQSGWLVLD